MPHALCGCSSGGSGGGGAPAPAPAPAAATATTATPTSKSKDRHSIHLLMTGIYYIIKKSIYCFHLPVYGFDHPTCGK